MKFITAILVSVSFLAYALSILGCKGIQVKECHYEVHQDPIFGGTIRMLICTGVFDNTAQADLMVQSIDPTQVILDVGSGSAQISSISGHGSIKKRNVAGAIVANGDFSWVKMGNSLVIIDPANVSAVLNSALGQAIKIEFSYDDIQAISSPGLNTLITKLFYENTAYMSEQTSWFCSSAQGGFPSPTSELICDI